MMERRAFDHVLIIMFENQYRGYVLENDYMRSLAAQGIELTNSYGCMHPSQTNYIASISGELCGVHNDDPPEPLLPQDTVVDLIERSCEGLDWRAYMDSYIADDTPWKAAGFAPRDHYPYVIKHNPFSSYANIVGDEKRWNKIDNEAGFLQDLLNGTLPEYSWFTPDMWHDGHYLVGTNPALPGSPKELEPVERAPVLVDQQAAWLKKFFGSIGFPGANSKLPPRTLVVVTYDEADFEDYYDPSKTRKYTYDGPNQIYTVLLGDFISPSKVNEGYNHYSLLRTIEKNFSLGDLGKNDRDSNWFQFLWGRRFVWRSPIETPVDSPRALRAVAYHGQIYVMSILENSSVECRTFDGATWSPAFDVGLDCVDELSLASNEDGLLLIARTKEGRLMVRRYDLDVGWQSCASPLEAPVAHIGVVALPHLEAFLVVTQASDGELTTIRYERTGWGDPSATSKLLSEGPFTLAALGSNIMLVYRPMRCRQLACLTYNSAPFNQLTISQGRYSGPADSTTHEKWSPCGFSLNHYTSAPSVVTPGEPEPKVEGYAAEGVIAHATLDGIVYLLHNSPGSEQLLSASFSLSGVMTPEHIVSYDPERSGTSNGYGTMCEAGWNERQAVPGVLRDSNGALAMAELDHQIWVFFVPRERDQLQACCGHYRKGE